MANFPRPAKDEIVLTHFIVSSDIERSRRFYMDVLAGEVLLEGEPTIVDKIHEQDVQLIINTPHGVTSGGSPRIDGYEIRTAAVAEGIPCITTVQGLAAAVQGIEALIEGKIGVKSLQDWGHIVTEARKA